jgi:2-oxoglutarate ferredoxin oxidoreductase subunit beta
VISPCVTFNDHEGSTKSYVYTREHTREVVQADLVPEREEIEVSYAEGSIAEVPMHDGTRVRLHKVAPDYDPTHRDTAYAYIRARQSEGLVATGLLYLGEGPPEMHDNENTVDTPLAELPFDQLCPGSAELDRLMESFR